MAPGDRAVPLMRIARWKSSSEAWVTGDVIRRDTMLAPVPWPTRVMLPGSPRKDWMMSGMVTFTSYLSESPTFNE